MESLPILLICGCTKYKKNVLSAIRRMTHSGYRTIGIIGHPESETYFDETNHLLTLKVEDSYEALPLKLQAAFQWIYTTFPECPGIFKTDDDIYFKEYSKLANEINKQKAIPYWCIKKDSCTKRHTLRRNVINRKYKNKTLRINVPKSIYCWGAGYWLSRTSMNYILKENNISYGPEDVLFGHILNKHKIIPKHVQINWKTLPRKN